MNVRPSLVELPSGADTGGIIPYPYSATSLRERAGCDESRTPVPRGLTGKCSPRQLARGLARKRSARSGPFGPANQPNLDHYD